MTHAWWLAAANHAARDIFGSGTDEGPGGLGDLIPQATERPDFIYCSRSQARWLIILTHEGDPYATVRELYNAGFRGKDLRLPEWGHA